ncbi:MAG: VacJ family lipoprotein [Gallionella sp.]|nr:VacJ family lipoprotein [Gallionella sp.]
MNVARILLAFLVIALTGCASPHARNPADPLESLNRGIYQFNDGLDRAIAKPVAKGYGAVMPTFGKTMVNNFFSNLDDWLVTINDLLQFKFLQAGSDGARVVINSTIGIFGLFDVAVGLEKHDEDFGQTLGYWGFGDGPYLMLPIFGPSSLRDGVGLLVDSQPSVLRRVEDIPTRNQLYVAKAISRREQLLDQEAVLYEAAVDRYEFIRDAYLLRRKSQVYDGNPPREKFEDEEEYDDTDKKQEPVPGTRQDSAPATQPGKQ